MEYLKDKEYNIKYLDSDGNTQEFKLKPNEDMSTPKVIKKLQNEDDKFVKLIEGKLFDKPITTYKVSFYVDDDETPYDEILEKTENALKNTGLASYIDKIEIEEYKVMDESKELLLENDNNTINSEKGFFIGDPCYVLSDERYDIWGNEYGYTDGRIKIEDYFMLVHGTAWGDGEYFDEQGYSYGVDSGTIAVIPLELVKQDIEDVNEGDFEYGRIVFGKEATLNYEDGFFYINIDNDTEVNIDTDPREEEYEEDEENFDENTEDSYGDEEWY